MSDPRTEHALHLALLALQTGLIDRAGFEAVLDAWNADRSRDVASLLADRGPLSPEALTLLQALAARHTHDLGTPTAALTALAANAGPSTVDELLTRAPELSESLLSRATDVDETFVSSTSGVGGWSGLTPASRPGGVRYRAIRFHARGGLGAVFVAMDEELKRNVALKEIQDHRAHQRADRERFIVEAEITGKLEHPGIVPVYGLGTYDDGRPFYAMRFIHGESLEKACLAFHDNPNPDPSARSLELRGLLRRFVDVCNAVEYAHSRGVLHRDLKPGNIMVGKYGETLVVDWGLARVMGRPEECDPDRHDAPIDPASLSGSAQTLRGHAIGTPGYMSPEQAEGKHDELGPASDVYSLGATLYHVLTGRGPFSGIKSLSELFERLSKGDVTPPRSVRPETPLALDAICRKAMALDPGRRYESPRALAEDIEHYLADEPIEALPDGRVDRLLRWTRHHRTAAITAVLLPLLIGAVAAALLVESARRRTTQALLVAESARTETTIALRDVEAAQGRTSQALREAEAARGQTTIALRKVEEAQRRTEQGLERENQAKQLAEANFARARLVVDDYLVTIGENQELKSSSRARELRRQLIEKAKQYYESFQSNRSEDIQLRAGVARAQIRLADTLRQLGDANKAKALTLYRQAAETFLGMLASDQVADEGLLELGIALNAIAYLSDGPESWTFPDSAQSKAILQDSRRLIAEGLPLATPPAVGQARFTCSPGVASIFVLQRLSSIRPKDPVSRRWLSIAIYNYVEMHKKEYDVVRLDGLLRGLIDFWDRRLRDGRSDLKELELLANLASLRAKLLVETGNTEAVPALQAERQWRERLVTVAPSSSAYRALLIACLFRLARQAGTGKAPGLVASIKQAEDRTSLTLTQIRSEVPSISDLITSFHQLALVYLQIGRLDDSLRLSERCAQLCIESNSSRLLLIASLKNMHSIYTTRNDDVMYDFMLQALTDAVYHPDVVPFIPGLANSYPSAPANVYPLTGVPSNRLPGAPAPAPAAPARAPAPAIIEAAPRVPPALPSDIAPVPPVRPAPGMPIAAPAPAPVPAPAPAPALVMPLPPPSSAFGRTGPVYKPSPVNAASAFGANTGGTTTEGFGRNLPVMFGD